MKKILQVVLSLILAVALLIPVTKLPAKAAEGEIVARFTYRNQVYEYDKLETAIANAATVGDLTVYLVSNYTIPSDLEIPSNLTLTIPTSANYNDTFSGNDNKGGEAPSPGDVHATLTVPSTLKLIVNGTLLVAGNQQSTTGRSGFLTGSYGAINLEGELIVNGKLYARGKIEGTGTVTANKGSSVYERFEISDWRGGNASKSSFDADVFPFNLYELGGIDTDLVVHAGASLFGQSYIYASTLGRGASIDVPYIGTVGAEGNYDVTGSILTFGASDTDGTITLSKANGKTNVTIENAEIETGNISYTVRIFGIPIYDFSSKNTDCPFGYNMDVIIKNSTVDIRTRIKFLPGSSFTVDAGSTLTITASGAMYFYAANTYEARYCNTIPAGWDVKLPAILQVNGGTVINNGTLASSSLGETIDNIKGLGEITKGEEVTVNEVTQSGTSVTIVPVKFYKAVLPTTAA